MSAAALAEYLIMKPDQQETVLHNSRFASPPVLIPHSEALNPIRAYCSDPARSKSILTQAKTSLTAKAGDPSIRPKSKEESLRCVETIGLFELAENAFGLRSLRLEQTERFPVLPINGVSVSVQPDLLIKPGGADEGKMVGVVMFRPQKAPDPESCRLEETKRQRGEHRREMGRYMLALAHLLIDTHGKELGGFSRELSIVADIRMQERIGFSTSDHSARVRAINAACKQIASLWSDIEPRKSVLAKPGG
ncbi:MAG TPA: hypothetical protein VF485_14815 [Sphingomonas sp.]